MIRRAALLFDFRRFLAAVGLVDFRPEETDRLAALRQQIDNVSVFLIAIAILQVLLALVDLPSEAAFYLGDVTHVVPLPPRFMAVFYAVWSTIVAINGRIYARICAIIQSSAKKVRGGGRRRHRNFSSLDVLYSDKFFDDLRPLYTSSGLSADQIRSHSHQFSWWIVGFTAGPAGFALAALGTYLAIYESHFGRSSTAFWLVGVPISTAYFFYIILTFMISFPLQLVFYMETRYYRDLFGGLTRRLARIRHRAYLGRLALMEAAAGRRTRPLELQQLVNPWSYAAQSGVIWRLLLDHGALVHRLTVTANRNLWRYYLAATILTYLPLSVLLMYVILFPADPLPPYVTLTLVHVLIGVFSLLIVLCVLAALVTKKINAFNSELIRFLILDPDRDQAAAGGTSQLSAAVSRKLSATIKMACSHSRSAASAATVSAFTVFEWFHLEFYTIVEIVLQTASWFLLVVQVREDY